MATLATQAVALTGLEAVYSAAAAGGDKFTPTRTTFLHVKNGDVSDKTVTVVTPGTVLGLAIADAATVVTAGEERFIGPFDPAVFAGSDGLASITYSAVTSVTVAVVVV